MPKRKKILIPGATGMLGHKLLQKLSGQFQVWGTVRGDITKYREYPALKDAALIPDAIAEDMNSVARSLDLVRPDVVVNCIGVIKQLDEARNPLVAIRLNAMLPHQLAELCRERGIRFIHFSTDCVFSGRQGCYSEQDVPDPDDLYGRSKLLGEVEGPNVLTLRTSIIGHELVSAVSLVDWFLSQTGRIKGYACAIYSGFPTVEMARILADVVIPNSSLNGIYHVSSQPISKFELLTAIAKKYGKEIEIIRDDEVKIDRSLDSTRFSQATGYIAPRWDELIIEMHRDYLAAQSR
ncbi:MAG: dTDP-4-dehydrorhamnose reductase family protein [Methylococcales bacterium]